MKQNKHFFTHKVYRPEVVCGRQLKDFPVQGQDQTGNVRNKLVKEDAIAFEALNLLLEMELLTSHFVAM